jgi:ketosteroid isomerase-like protein
MKRYSLVVVALVLAFGGAGGAQTAKPAASRVDAAGPPTSGVEPTITQLERDWAAAIVHQDIPALDRLLAEEFNGTSPTAHTFPKTVAVREVQSGKYVVASMVLDDISVNVYGDTAVAFTSQQEQSRYAGTDTSGHYHFTDVWAKKDGRWQVVASHGSRFTDRH